MSNAYFSFKNAAEFLKFLTDEGIQFIDMNFTDLNGRLHRMTEHVGAFDKNKIETGVYFDGSSVAGWKDIHASDMIMKPDLSRVTPCPFAAQKTVKMFCDIHDPETGGAPYGRDPRSIAKAAEHFLTTGKIADTAYFGPEAEFFVFDDVRIDVDTHRSGYVLDSEELPSNAKRETPTGNMAHRPTHKGGYVHESPVDRLGDIRGEMLTVLASMGVAVEKHHHEVAPAQCELGIKYNTLLAGADDVQVYKHVVKNVAHAYGRTATFMPKPILGDNGSGMHVHQSLWRKGKPLFAGKDYAGLSDTALFYIGGIIRHARALNAFTNPSTNSYKRLVLGYEAPVSLAYSARNRSASIRIPQSESANGKRIEARFPDPMANPYLSFAAMLMAGMDGIEHKIHPGEAMDKNLYDLPADEAAQIPTVAHSLRAALGALDKDREFLLKGDVFSNDVIDAFIALKMAEVRRIEMTPTAAEFDLYYSG